MEHQLINIKKYPKSASGLQCIGPCYPKNKTSMHPIRMDIMREISQFLNFPSPNSMPFKKC